MIRALFIIGYFAGAGALLQGQSNRSSNAGSDILQRLRFDEDSEQLSIQLDSLLIENYDKLLVKNRQESGISGYRIRIYSESGLGAKEEQQRVRARFLSYFPRIDAYYQYDEPFFKVYVGDCRTRSEALKLNDKIKKYFPNPFIVPYNINLKITE